MPVNEKVTMKHIPELSSKDVEIVESDVIYEGHLKLLKYQFKYRLFAGGWSAVVKRELLKAHQAVGVLLFDPQRDEIVLIEEFRLGALEQNSPWLLEIVAGIVDSEESLVEVAKRESQEEAGCEVMELIPMCEYWTSPGISSGKFSLFCGRVDASTAGGIFGLSHEHEDIRAHVFPKQYVYNAIKTGEINNAATLIAVQWLQLHEHEVKQRWK